jgi:hypothetical protein
MNKKGHHPFPTNGLEQKLLLKCCVQIHDSHGLITHTLSKQIRLTKAMKKVIGFQYVYSK